MGGKIKVVDLFAGCGGLTDGFKKTGLYQTIACVEWEKEPCNTLKKRLKERWGYKNPDEVVIQFDIQRVESLINGWETDPVFPAHQGLGKMAETAGGLDIIVGGPPCQAYSIAGRVRDENGMNDDYRNFLFESYVKIVDHFRPKAFIFENVPGMLSATPGGISIVERVTEAFKEIGFEIIADLRRFALLDCTEFGVPQSRKRVIILGVNKNLICETPQIALLKFYKHILPKYKSDKLETVEDAIMDLPKIFPLDEPTELKGKKYSHFFQNFEIPNHIPRMHNKRDMEIFRELASDIESKQNKFASIDSIKELYYQKTGKRSNIHKYYVLRRDKPSNTIPAHLYKDGLRHIHPDSAQARTITVREAARLQTFDDDFEFTGSLTEQYKMVGNAVPPKLAQAIALALRDFLSQFF
ncbi:MAG TPA: DNA cytosine methyltransferase [Pyrinomonadaceae bacterium]|jgi:DNA (cytosine-5)-methyltransferase 1